jgi:hypothetical protein
MDEIVDGFPRPIAAALWSTVEVRDAAPEGRRRVTIDAAVTVPAGYELRFYSGPQNGGATALYNRIMQPGETFTTSGSLPLGSTCYNLLFWRRIDDGAWAQASENQIAFPIAGLQPAAPLPAVPLLLAAPVLAGAGTIGDPVTVDPGQWSGEPAPTLGLVWCRDGTPIEGATGSVYTPEAPDDLTELTCRVTATNASGTVEAVTAGLSITFEAPVAAGGLADEVFDEGSGDQSVETAQDFTGENLSFAVAGAGASIDPETGVVTIPTDAPASRRSS